MLIELTEAPKLGVAITHAWRRYELDRSRTPTATFAELLQECGMEVAIGAVEGKFIAATVDPPGGEGIAGIDASARSMEVGAMMRRAKDGSTEWHWVNALDRGSYDRTVARQRG